MPLRSDDIDGVDPELYHEYRDRVIELGNHVTRMEDGEYTAELRSAAQIAEEIDELSAEQVAEIRNVALNLLTPMELYQIGDVELR